jgi:hypothetical protein
VTKKQLIQFGQKLVAKGRTPIEIRNAIALKATSNKELNEVLEQVFIDEKPQKSRSSERVKILLKANRVKLNFEYSMRSLIRIAAAILVLGGITYGLSSEEVNKNGMYGWMTLAQGVVTLLLFSLVKIKSLMNLLLVAVILYFALWLVELAIWGIPNDLLKIYDRYPLKIPSNSYKLRERAGGARVLGVLFPYLYLGVKLLFGGFIFTSYRNYRRFESLSQDVKDDLLDL